VLAPFCPDSFSCFLNDLGSGRVGDITLIRSIDSLRPPLTMEIDGK